LKPANWSRRLSAGTLIAAGTAGSMVLLSAVAPAGAVTGPSGPGSGDVVVPQGITAASLHGTRISAAPASTRLTVSFVLKLRNVNELKSDVEGGMKHGFLSVKRFSGRYGQTHANIVALERYLKNHGIKSTTYADGLDIHTTGTAGDYTAALGTPESLYRLKAVPAHGNQAARPAMVVHGTTSPALLPARFGKFVFAVLGLTNYPVQASNAVHTPLATQKANGHAVQLGNRTPGNFASQYGLNALYKKGARGQGETLGIITFANFRPSDATHFWNTTIKIKTKARRIKQDNVDGGPGRPSANSGSGETTLDVEQSGALAPQANIIVYQAPNSDFGAADAWFTAASQNKAASVSTSWGESEILNEAIGADGLEAATYGGIFDEAGLEMAAQGQSTFDASGDLGAYDDAGDVNPSNGNPTPYTELSVDNPANSPWITAGGGTTNSGQIPIADSQQQVSLINIPKQRAWGWDYLWPFFATISFITGDDTEGSFASDPNWTAGGGGGYSTVEPRPTYQNAVPGVGNFRAVPYLTPTTGVTYNTASACALPMPITPQTGLPCLPTAWTSWADGDSGVVPPPAVITGSATGRAVPDLAADADPDTGYKLYYSGQNPRLESGWGGTSFVAPQLNGSAAVIDSFLHHRTGFWNPAIYRFATKSYTPFSPINASGASNDNLFYTGTAGTKYNPGTGLGTPNLGKLALDFRDHG
jgi:kumamolisin